MKKNTIVIILIALILAVAWLWLTNDKENDNTMPPTLPESQLPLLIAQATYICEGGKTIEAAFFEGKSKTVEPGQPPVPSGSVKIVLSDGRSYDLVQTISASGARYANSDESFVFWDKGGNALVLENGAEKDYTGCTASEQNNETQGIKVISPNGGEAWSKAQKVQISWEAGEETESVNIRLAILESSEGQNFNGDVAFNVPNTGNYEWTVRELYAEVLGINDLPVSDKYILIIEDSKRNEIYDRSDATFSIK